MLYCTLFATIFCLTFSLTQTAPPESFSLEGIWKFNEREIAVYNYSHDKNEEIQMEIRVFIDIQGNGGKVLYRGDTKREYFVFIENNREVKCESTERNVFPFLESSFAWLGCATSGYIIDPQTGVPISYYELDLFGERFFLRLNQAGTIPIDLFHESRRGYSLLEIEKFTTTQIPFRFDVPAICS